MLLPLVIDNKAVSIGMQVAYACGFTQSAAEQPNERIVSNDNWSHVFYESQELSMRSGVP